ncbi:MAG: AAA family ATPase [Clostridiales bacterium]|nr:AAA family ATPase [Clostridiales bacterium]
MVGLPGSGKTTTAKKISTAYQALRLTPDEWHFHLFGNDFYNETNKDKEHDIRHTKIEELMWVTAKELLLLGVDVILDFGFWTKAERDDFRTRAHTLGANFKLHYTPCSIENIWERLKQRNKDPKKEATFSISKETLDEWNTLFEPPTKEELLLSEKAFEL